MHSAKHIGIVAVSAEGAALCYRTICSEGAAQFGVHGHPKISMYTFPFLISQEDSPLPVNDSTRTLARAALREAAGAKQT